MSDQKKPREFEITRTPDNKQLGLSVLIDSLKAGETKTFIEKRAYDYLHEQWTLRRSEVEQLRADLDLAIEALKKAKFVLEGSVAIEGQSDDVLEKRGDALFDFLETLAKLQERK